MFAFFFFYCYGHNQDLHSFPTRRSSDLKMEMIPGSSMVEHSAVNRNVGGSNPPRDRKSTRLNSSHTVISYAVFCLKKKKKAERVTDHDDRQRDSAQH